jgi:hypothetical protein
MGKPPGTFACFLPVDGTIMFDVATEFASPDQSFTELHLCYAQGMTNTLPATQEPYALVLRAEGGGPAIRCSIDLGGRLSWRLDGLKGLATSTAGA